MNKVMRIGTVDNGNGRRVSVYIKAEYNEGKLSISGVVGPTVGGNAIGGCGQIDMEFAHRNPSDNDRRYSNPTTPAEINFAKGWNADKWYNLLDIWHKWHLNDMRANCQHQIGAEWDTRKELTLNNGEKKIAGWVYPSEHKDGLLTKACPICGYKYGTAWLKEDVPQDVIDFLVSLPDADRSPAWV